MNSKRQSLQRQNSFKWHDMLSSCWVILFPGTCFFFILVLHWEIQCCNIHSFFILVFTFRNTVLQCPPLLHSHFILRGPVLQYPLLLNSCFKWRNTVRQQTIHCLFCIITICFVMEKITLRQILLRLVRILLSFYIRFW